MVIVLLSLCPCELWAKNILNLRYARRPSDADLTLEFELVGTLVSHASSPGWKILSTIWPGTWRIVCWCLTHGSLISLLPMSCFACSCLPRESMCVHWTAVVCRLVWRCTTATRCSLRSRACCTRCCRGATRCWRTCRYVNGPHPFSVFFVFGISPFFGFLSFHLFWSWCLWMWFHMDCLLVVGYCWRAVVL